MKIKKIFLVLIGLILITGCVNVQDLSYEEAVNYISYKKKEPNKFKKGYQFYVPHYMDIIDESTNYVILSDSYTNYYMYIDLINYINKSEIDMKNLKGDIYSRNIVYDKKIGYVTINSYKNNQYLIEIMYNYAKIEVMVDEDLINRTIINAISILSSLDYNDDVVNEMLNSNKLNYTEEEFDFFEGIKDSGTTNYLDYDENDNEDTDNDNIIDTDFIN